MKSKLLSVLLLVLSITSFAQNSGPGYAQLNDFSMPFMRSVFWMRSAIPAGSVPILTMSGTNSFRIHPDSVFMNTLAVRNDTTVYKLVQIGSDAMLRAFVPSYLVYRDTLSLSNRINLKFSIQDTANHWLSIGYVPDWNTIVNKPNFLDSTTIYSIINGKLAIADTIGKWTSIGRFISDSINIQAKLDLKMDKADSILFYPRFSNPAVYIKSSDTAGKWLAASTHIPVDPVNSNWNSASGLSQILNKPIIPTVPTNVSAFNNDAGYLNSGRTLTINGSTLDLTTNRTWNVGDILSTGSYPNPNWLSSLAWGKINGTPTTLSGYGITDGVTSSSLTSTLAGYTTSSALTTALSSYATTSALTTGLSGKQNTLTLTTTGTSGNATLVGSTLNIPTPSIPAQFTPTAGTGISITGSYPNNTIINSAPDQTVSLTAGANTSISGTYPNFTIGETLTTKVYKASGVVNQAIKIWSDVVTPSTSNGYSIDISSAGFTTILSANVIAIRNTTAASTSPNVSIKSQSTTAITVNVVEDNPSTIAILGISVLSGLPSIFANVTGLSLSVTVIGY